jgi:hypothetical protein
MKNILLIFCFVSAHILFAQSNLQIDWQSCFGGSENDHGYDIVPTEDGYLVFGYSLSEDGDITNSHGDGDVWIIRIDSTGGIIWERSYGGSQPEFPNNIIKYDEDIYYFGAGTWSNDGDVQSGNHGGYDRWIVKINGQGEILWENCYGGSLTEYGGFIKKLNNGNLLTYGATVSSDGDVPVNYGVLDVWLMIISPDGEILNNAVFGNIGQNNIFDIVETADGGFFMAIKAQEVEGMVQGNFHGEDDVWAVKLDSSLNMQWQKLYGGSYFDYGYYGILELDDGYLFLASTNSNDGDVSGFHGAAGTANPDIWAVRIDTIGNIMWQRCLGGNKPDWGSKLFKEEDGGFYVFGETQSNNGDVSGNYSWNGYADIWMVKLSADGELEWQECFGGEGNERIYKGIIRKSEHDWVLTGRTNYNTYDVNCDLHAMEDYWVFEIKDTTTGLLENIAGQNKIKVYPNPAKDYMIFEAIEHIQLNHSEILIQDIYGNQIASLILNSPKTVWDTRNIPGGIYFYQTIIDGEFMSGKVVISK